MNMVFNPANRERRGIQVIADPSQIGVEILSEGFVLKKRSAMFRREDDVQIDLDQGLGHGEAPVQPLRGRNLMDSLPRVRDFVATLGFGM
jgi:hypothetical protein